MNATLTRKDKENRQVAPSRAETQAAAVDRTYLSPFVNIFETSDGYVLEAEMPGVNKDGLEVLLEGNELTLIGRRHQEPLPGEVLYRESRPASYRRVFELDPAIDTSKINARMENGLLILSLPKAERVKPRRISVSD